MSRRGYAALAIAIVFAVVVAVSLWHTNAPAPESEQIDDRSRADHAANATDEFRRDRRSRIGVLGASGAPQVPLRLWSAEARRDPAAVHGAISGVVVSTGADEPIEKAELSFLHRGQSLSVISNPRGEFELVGRSAGAYELTAVQADGYLPFAPELGHSPVVFELRKDTRIEGVRIQLSKAIDYTGVVVTSDGTHVAGAIVTLMESGTGESALSPLPSRFITGNDGSFVFNAPDYAVLEARHPEHGIGRGMVDYSVQVQKRLAIELEPNAPRADKSIAGVVTDPNGEPVLNAVVRAAFDPENRAVVGAQAHPLAQTLTDHEGRFTLENLDTGRYTVTALAGGYGPAQKAVEAGGSRVTLRLAEEQWLRGRVVRAEDKKPIPAFVVVIAQPLGAVERATVAVESIFDAEGRFEIGGVKEGFYEVSVTAHGYEQGGPTVASLPDAPELSFSLARGGTFVGRVTSSPGGAIPGARVSLEGQLGEGPSVVPLAVSTSTDEEGVFTLNGVGTGSRSIFVAAEGHHARILSGLIAQSGQKTRVDVELEATKPDETPRLELAGIGAVLSPRQDVVLVGSVIEGGGAKEVGLVEGDAVLAVDGVSVAELGFGGTIERIRGPENSLVMLKVRRTNGNEEIIPVPRRRVRT